MFKPVRIGKLAGILKITILFQIFLLKTIQRLQETVKKKKSTKNIICLEGNNFFFIRRLALANLLWTGHLPAVISIKNMCQNNL